MTVTAASWPAASAMSMSAEPVVAEVKGRVAAVTSKPGTVSPIELVVGSSGDTTSTGTPRISTVPDCSQVSGGPQRPVVTAAASQASPTYGVRT